jgi:hypothetical protein
MKKVSSSVITLAAACMFAASLYFQCSPMEDGTYMNCHKANIAVAVLAGVIAVIGILLFVLRGKMVRRILLGVSAVAAVICALTPGIIISLCMMPEMTCRAVLRPIAIIGSVVILLFVIVGFLSEKKERV